MTPPHPWSGGCQCGRVRYRVLHDPLTLYCCHCTECQRQSSSAFGMSMLMAREALDVDWSAMRSRGRPAAGGREVVGWFCPDCGVRIVHCGFPGDVVSLKAGSLDETSWLRPVGHIWTRSAQPWLALASALLAYSGPPDDNRPLYEAWARQCGAAAAS